MSKAPLFFRLYVKVIEDLHTGTGTGSGDIDALVMRDRRGRPVVPASHLKGLLREAGDELVDLGLIEQKALDALLGHDVFNRAKSRSNELRRGALRLRSLRVKSENGATLIWGSSAREENGRRPAHDTLRYVEYIAAGTEFEAEGLLDEPAVKSVLETLLGRIDRLGGNRSRGDGLVHLRHDWGRLEERLPPPPNDATCLRLVLRNLEPLCLPATAHPGNLIPSHSFIRGQALRGALMAWAIRRNGVKADLARVSVGDALPLPDTIEKAAELVPIPLSIMTEKPTGGSPDLPWWAQGASQIMFDGLGKGRDPDKEKPKRPGRHEYLCRHHAKSPWLRYAPEMNVRLRNQTPKNGSQDEAILFSLEEIAEDTLFQADVSFDLPSAAEAFWEAFAPLLSGGDWLAMGRGGQPVRVEGVHWQRLGHRSGTNENGWTLTLTSDLVLRGPMLGFLSDLNETTLCALAGIGMRDGWEIADRVVETDVIHGFNGVSGMHRNPVVAIRRGSCWKITGTGSGELATKLLKKNPLGERTREGFGRFAIDMQPVKDLQKASRPPLLPKKRPQERLLSKAKNLADCCSSCGPSLSQLQWLRTRALAATSNEQFNELLLEIENAPKDRPQGGKAWTKFPIEDLKKEVAGLCDVRDKALLIAYVVQWLTPAAKNGRKVPS